ncbi:MAG: rod shape-determining protein MreC [Lachnospiraceae bacterium]
MKTKNQITLSSKYWLIILIVICVLLMGISYFTDIGKGPFSNIANYTVVPMQKGINKIGMWMSDLTENFETLQDMKKENKNLQQQVDDLTIVNGQLQQEKYELDRLQTLYKLDQNYAEYQKVGAHVIANNGSNWFNSFTIDKGTNDGMKVDMNVLAGSGLVGIIIETAPNYSIVRSIIDDASNVSGMVLTTADRCMVRGDLVLMNEGKIKFDQLANNENEIKEGEEVVTSYISNKYLQGLRIGYLSKITVDANNLTKSGYVIPAVDFRHLQEVLIITTTKKEMVDK